MAELGVKMGVSGISQFKSAMKQAQQSVKTLDAELKLNEKQYQASGDGETYMAQKAQLLKKQMDAQKAVIKQAEQALKTMTEQGVNKASIAYQQMEQQLAKAQAGLIDMQQAMNGVGNSSAEAADGADKLAGSINSIDKKVSLENVLTGINSITSGLENAAKKAVEVGQTIWNEIMDRAQWADDTATQAMMLDMGIEEYQRYKNVFDTFAEMTVSDWQKAKLKVQKAMYDPTSDQVDVFAALGISPTEGGGAGKFGDAAGIARDWETVFWQAGKKLSQMVENKQISQDQADVYANALFGKGFASLKPMMDMGAEEFYKAIHEQKVVTEDAVKDMATMNDTIATMKQRLETLETEIMAGLAPALTEASKAMTALLDKLIEYVQSPGGQKMLEDLGTAVSGLFEDLGKIDPDEVISGFTDVFNTVVGSFQWLVTNQETVKGLLKAICIAWGAAKITGGALQVLQLVTGIQGLAGAGAASAAAQAGAAAGSSWGTSFAAAVAKAAPWLVGAYVMLKPGETEDNSIIDDQQQQYWDQYTKGMTEPQKNDLWNEIWGEKYFQQSIGKTEAEIATLWQNMFADYAKSHPVAPEGDSGTGKTHPGGRVRHITGVGEIPITEPEIEPGAEYVDLDEAETMLQLTKDQIAAAQEYWDVMRDGTKTVDQQDMAYQDLLDHFIGDDASMAQLTSLLSLVESLPESFEDLPEMWWNGGDDIIVEPEVDVEYAQEQLDANPLTVPVIPKMWGSGSVWGSGGGVPGGKWLAMPRANGLPFVPFDGYPAILHKGERVMTARENASRSFSSNLYVESMYMNSGADADGLAAKIAAQNRRIMAGHGS